jgi:hypothetical protein
VEVAGPFHDPDAWLRARRFHCTAVLAALAEPPPSVAAGLEEHQPQAPVLPCGDDATSAVDALQGAGVLPDVFGEPDTFG